MRIARKIQEEIDKQDPYIIPAVVHEDEQDRDYIAVGGETGGVEA